MNFKCPNSTCPDFRKSTSVVKDGFYCRRGDSRRIQRYRCSSCNKRFSRASNSLNKYQKKRRINPQLEKLLCSGVSIRRSAILVGVNVKTVMRRIEYFGERGRLKNLTYLKMYKKNPVKEMQIDDLITKENSKLKPLAVSIAVDSERRCVLGARVKQIPAFGHLASLSRQKYGRRECRHREGLKELFDLIHSYVAKDAKIVSDEHSKYPAFVERYFPNAIYERFPSERSCVAGQGELKKTKYDPLFSINHTCAMFRANINRLIRKTWCTTKNVERLQDHIDMFINFYNRNLLKESSLKT